MNSIVDLGIYYDDDDWGVGMSRGYPAQILTAAVHCDSSFSLFVGYFSKWSVVFVM